MRGRPGRPSGGWLGFLGGGFFRGRGSLFPVLFLLVGGGGGVGGAGAVCAARVAGDGARAVAAMAAVILQASGLSRAFGGLQAVDGVDFELQAGEIHALIGPNGAGKTTFVSLLSGRIKPDAGVIRLGGSDITALPAHARVRAGVASTFPITSIYPRLSVFDNVALAVRGGDLAASVMAALRRVGLAERADQVAGNLSYGHQRLLEGGMGGGPLAR